jgi:hypothetical protein
VLEFRLKAAKFEELRGRRSGPLEGAWEQRGNIWFRTQRLASLPHGLVEGEPGDGLGLGEDFGVVAPEGLGVAVAQRRRREDRRPALVDQQAGKVSRPL